MLSAEMIDALRCPLCHSPLRTAPGALRCTGGHSFDVAKQGYVHLGMGKKLPPGDTAPMVEARLAFLHSGYFAPLASAVSAAVNEDFAPKPAATSDAGGPATPTHEQLPADHHPGPTRPATPTHDRLVADHRPDPIGSAMPARERLVADLGSGPAYYLASAMRLGFVGLAFDVSKPALRQAARAHPRIGAVLADTWSGLPLADESVDILLNIFAPRNGSEMRRVLRPGGRLIVVTPEPDHLGELRAALGLLDVDEAKPERLAATLTDFEPVAAQLLHWSMHLSIPDIQRLVMMGPNAFHHSELATEAMTVTASVRLSTWTGRPLPSRPAGRDAGR